MYRSSNIALSVAIKRTVITWKQETAPSTKGRMLDLSNGLHLRKVYPLKNQYFCSRGSQQVFWDPAKKKRKRKDLGAFHLANILSFRFVRRSNLSRCKKLSKYWLTKDFQNQNIKMVTIETHNTIILAVGLPKSKRRMHIFY